jgi:hypothetical protein
MNSTWPKEVVDFEDFLTRDGLSCQHREESPSFGDKLLQYANARIGVRVGSDRGVWFVDIADMSGRPEEWYDAAIRPGEDVLPLPEKIELIEAHWPAIIERFSLPQQEDTHARLALLRQECAKRRYPGFFLHPELPGTCWGQQHQKRAVRFILTLLHSDAQDLGDFTAKCHKRKVLNLESTVFEVKPFTGFPRTQSK